MFADQEATDRKCATGADPLVGIWVVGVIHRECDGCIEAFLPRAFEILSPRGKVSKTADVVQAYV